MNSQWPLKKKEDLKGNSSNLRMTDPMPVKPVVSVEGVPCQTSQAGLVSKLASLGRVAPLRQGNSGLKSKCNYLFLYCVIEIFGICVFLFERFLKAENIFLFNTLFIFLYSGEIDIIFC